MKTGLQIFPVLLLVLLGLQTSIAQGLTWQKVSGLYGGGGQKVLVGKDNYIYVRTIENVFYRSNNAGQSWEQLPNTPANEWQLKINAGADGNLYSLVNNSLYRSVDNGISWGVLSTNITNGTAYAIQNGDILIGNNSQIRKSSDNGATWQTVATNIQADGGFIQNPYNGDVYSWAEYTSTGTNGKLWRSSDNGASWQVALEKPEMTVSQIAFSPNGAIFVGVKDFIWRTLDNGFTWSSLDGHIATSARAISVAVSNTGRLFAHEWFLSKYSDDNGETWTDVEDIYENYFREFSADQNGNIFAVREGSNSLYRSSDNGLSWQFASNNILYANTKAIHHLDDSKLLVLTTDGLHYSKDGGSSWSVITRELSIDVSLLNNNLRIASSNTGDWYFFDGQKVKHFTNEGQSVTDINTSSILGNPNGFNGIWIDPQTQHLFFSSWSGFFKSTDKGQTWTLHHQSAEPEYLVFLPDGSWLSFIYGSIARSADQGITWEPVVNAPSLSWLIGVQSSANGLIYGISAVEGLYSSADGGFTWNLQPIPDIASAVYYGMVVNNAGQVFFKDQLNDVIRYSIDGGLTFNSANTPVENSYDYFPLSISPSQHLYFLTEREGLYKTSMPTNQIKVLKGQAWADVDKDCTYTTPDSLESGYLVKAVKNGDSFYGFSNPNGIFQMPITAGNYQLSVVPPSDYWESCITNLNIPANSQIGVVDSVDIGLKVLTECPLLQVSLSAPFLRRCFESDVYVRYENLGTIPAENAVLTLTFDSLTTFVSASAPILSQNGNQVKFDLGDVAVGGKGSIKLKVIPSCLAELGYRHCISAEVSPDELCPALSGPQIVSSAACLGDSIRFSIQNIGDGPMATPLNWYAFEMEGFNPNSTGYNGQFQLAAGEIEYVTLPAGGNDMQFYARQVDTYPFNELSNTQVFGCGTSPSPLGIVTLDERGPFHDLFCQPNIGAYDPNDKQVIPAGLTEEGYVEIGSKLRYLIRFQNTGTDTAFNISIRDTLPVSLDVATIQFLNSSHPCELRMNTQGNLQFVFANIMLPDSNINEAASHGFVEFSIDMKRNTPFGTKIRNRAGIYFDFNEPVITNYTHNTAGIPSVTGVQDTKPTLAQISVAPNPFTDQLRVNLNDYTSKDALRLSLYDARGLLVASSAFYPPQGMIFRNNLPAGIYFLALHNEQGVLIASEIVEAK